MSYECGQYTIMSFKGLDLLPFSCEMRPLGGTCPGPSRLPRWAADTQGFGSPSAAPPVVGNPLAGAALLAAPSLQHCPDGGTWTCTSWNHLILLSLAFFHVGLAKLRKLPQDR